MSDPNVYTSDDYTEPDSDTRVDAALHCAGTTADVETFIPDWGHHDGDYSANQQALSFEHTDIDSTDREYVIYDKELIDE
jgi:hypothetical protein